MKTQILLALTALVLITLACSLLSSPGGEPVSPEDSGDTPSSVHVTEAPSESQDAGAGPETIDLSDPALYPKDTYPTFKMDTSLKYDGVDITGSSKTFNMNFKVESQEEPKAQYIWISSNSAEEGMEFVTMGDQSMSVFPGVGCTVFPTSSMEDDSPEEMVPDVSGSFKGQAQRVETDIDIEGILTDRYALTSENMTDNTVVTDGSMYVARDGGYIVRIEFVGTSKTGEMDFDPDAETQMSMSYTFIPVEDGSLVITPPDACAEQLAGGSKYPVMDGASDLISMGDTVFYTVNASLEEVQNFYRTKMVEDGWTLVDDVGGGSISFATLEFSKDGEAVEVSAITTGEGVSVTITKK